MDVCICHTPYSTRKFPQRLNDSWRCGGGFQVCVLQVEETSQLQSVLQRGMEVRAILLKAGTANDDFPQNQVNVQACKKCRWLGISYNPSWAEADIHVGGQRRGMLGVRRCGEEQEC